MEDHFGGEQRDKGRQWSSTVTRLQWKDADLFWELVTSHHNLLSSAWLTVFNAWGHVRWCAMPGRGKHTHADTEITPWWYRPRFCLLLSLLKTCHHSNYRTTSLESHWWWSLPMHFFFLCLFCSAFVSLSHPPTSFYLIEAQNIFFVLLLFFLSVNAEKKKKKKLEDVWFKNDWMHLNQQLFSFNKDICKMYRMTDFCFHVLISVLMEKKIKKGFLSIYASNKKGQWATFRKWKVHPEEI